MEKVRKGEAFLRLVFIPSGMATAAILMQTQFLSSFLITLFLAGVVAAILAFKTGIPRGMYRDKRLWEVILASLLTLSILKDKKSLFYEATKPWVEELLERTGLPMLLMRLLPWGVALLALPVCFGAMLWFVHFMAEQAVDFRKKADYTEWLYLIGAGILLLMMVAFSYMCTQAFYGAHINGGWYNFDLIYSADSGYLVKQDVFRNPAAEQNDLRQPLFGVFALPFAQIAGILADIFTFIPEGYITILQVMQVFLLLIAFVLIARMMGLQGPEKAIFLVLLTVSYPTLIFVLTAEQYLFAVFYLVLGIYLSHERVEGGVCYIAATGSMLTSGALFPVFTWDRDFKTFVKNTAILCGAFFAVTILTGRLTTLLDIGTYIKGYGYYTGVDVNPIDKLMQYVNFAGSMLIAPASEENYALYEHFSWQMCPVTFWRPLGFVMLALSISGVVLTRKERFSRICGGWMAFSFLLLGIVGWGTIDNGLMLYTLYFGWAFVSMAYRAASLCLEKLPLLWLRRAASVAVILVISFVNITALRAVLVFATQFYPVVR